MVTRPCMAWGGGAEYVPSVSPVDLLLVVAEGRALAICMLGSLTLFSPFAILIELSNTSVYLSSTLV